MHFDYCTTASIDFVMLDEASFSNILQVIIIPSLFFNLNNMNNVAILDTWTRNHHLDKESLDYLVRVNVCKEEIFFF